MVNKIAGTMHIFGVVFLIASIIAAIAAYIAAMSDEKEAADLAKKLFNNCICFALLLWVLAWLIS
jgi:hypothetical protein